MPKGHYVWLSHSDSDLVQVVLEKERPSSITYSQGAQRDAQLLRIQRRLARAQRRARVRKS